MKPHIKGMLAGWALWGVLAVVEFVYESLRTGIPNSVKSVTDFIYLCVNIAVWPLEVGGWFIWGDGSWPAWVGWPLMVAIGLVIWGTLGVVTGAIYDRGRKRGRALPLDDA